MGKRLITQARGKGGPRYRARSFAAAGPVEFPVPTESAIRGEVLDIIHNSMSSSPLMIIKFENDSMALLPAPVGIKVRDTVYSGAEAPVQLGCIVPLGSIPAGQQIHSLERVPYNGPELVRTAGSAATVVGREGDMILVRLPSKKSVLLDPRCRAAIGTIAGSGKSEKPWTKAGKKWIALRAKGGKVFPQVAGVAKNAVDHPFGATHRRTKGRPTTTRGWGIPPGRKVGLLRARKTGRGK
jgi:large subunit ribosomal protein L2